MEWLVEPVRHPVDNVEVRDGICNFPYPPVGVSLVIVGVSLLNVLRVGNVSISLIRHKSII